MTDAIEAGARAMEAAEFGYRLTLTRLVDGVHTYTLTYDDGTPELTFEDISDGYAHIAEKKRTTQAKACIEAAIASGALVPASAVAEMRERCAKLCEDLRHVDYSSESPDWFDGTVACADAIRQLDLAPACGDYVVGWRDISTAPHETYVLLGWWDEGKWNCETGFASHGWRRNGVSNMSMHSQATHWRNLPDGPPLHAATRTGGEK